AVRGGRAQGTITADRLWDTNGGRIFVRNPTRRSRVARLWAALAAFVVVPAALAVSTANAGAASSNTLTVKAGEYTYILNGMHKVFTISGKSSAKPPTDGVSQVTITDSGIELPSKGLPAHGWVKATNNSSVNRDVALAEYASPDATFDQANAYYNEFFNSGK